MADSKLQDEIRRINEGDESAYVPLIHNALRFEQSIYDFVPRIVEIARDRDPNNALASEVREAIEPLQVSYFGVSTLEDIGVVLNDGYVLTSPHIEAFDHLVHYRIPRGGALVRGSTIAFPSRDPYLYNRVLLRTSPLEYDFEAFSKERYFLSEDIDKLLDGWQYAPEKCIMFPLDTDRNNEHVGKFLFRNLWDTMVGQRNSDADYSLGLTAPVGKRAYLLLHWIDAWGPMRVAFCANLAHDDDMKGEGLELSVVSPKTRKVLTPVEEEFIPERARE